MMKSEKRTMRLLAPILMLASLLAGCSTTAMKTTPLWEGEYRKAVGPPENRVNIWPLFYYRNPAWSLIWPVVSVTDEGSAVIPAYEYSKADEALRLLFLHQGLPSGALLTKDYWRVLNTARDRKRNTFLIAPFYFQNFKTNELWVIPVLYRQKQWFWTPLVTHTKHLDGVLGPLFCVYDDGGGIKYYHFPFPLAGFKSRANTSGAVPETSGFWALPAVYYDRTGQASHLNLGVALLDLQRDEKSWQAHYAGLLGGVNRGANGDTSNYLVPLWAAWKKGDKQGMLSIPWSTYQNGEYQFTDVLLNGWIDIRDGQGRYQGFFWPVGQVWSGPAGSGSAVLPVYYANRTADGGRTLVTPLGGMARSAERDILDLGGPFYFHKRDAAGAYTTVAWPLAHAWSGKDEKGTALLPLYYESRGADGKRVLATPFGGMLQAPDETILSLAGPLFWSHRDGKAGKNYRAVAWPLWQEWEAQDKKEKALLPVFYMEKDKGGYAFVSLPVSFGADAKSEFLNIGGVLYHHRSGGASEGTFLLADVIGWERSRDGKRSEAHAFPVFSYEDTPDYRDTSVLLSGHYQSKKDEATLRRELEQLPEGSMNSSFAQVRLLEKRHALLFLYQSEARLVRRGSDEPPKTREAGTAGANLTTPAVRRQETGTFLPLLWHWDRTEGVGGRSEIFWRLYDGYVEEKPEGGAYTRQRVLWRVFHRETEGDRVSIDVFPFITWDRTKEMTRFSFAGGLLGGGSKDGKGYVQVFYVKF